MKSENIRHKIGSKTYVLKNVHIASFVTFISFSSFPFPSNCSDKEKSQFFLVSLFFCADFFCMCVEGEMCVVGF